MTQLPATKRIATALLAVVIPVLAVLAAFNVVDIDSDQTQLAYVFVAAVVWFVVAVIAHFRPDTTDEPVQLGTSFTAVVAAGMGALNGFDVTHLSGDQMAKVMGAIAVLLAFGVSWAQRSAVIPVDDAKANEAVARYSHLRRP
jgi:uncharacterized membrane protein YfcA